MAAIVEFDFEPFLKKMLPPLDARYHHYIPYDCILSC